MPFPQRSIQTLERNAPCGGLIGGSRFLPTERPSQIVKLRTLSSHLQHCPSLFKRTLLSCTLIMDIQGTQRGTTHGHCTWPGFQKVQNFQARFTK